MATEKNSLVGSKSAQPR